MSTRSFDGFEKGNRNGIFQEAGLDIWRRGANGSRMVATYRHISYIRVDVLALLGLWLAESARFMGPAWEPDWQTAHKLHCFCTRSWDLFSRCAMTQNVWYASDQGDSGVC